MLLNSLHLQIVNLESYEALKVSTDIKIHIPILLFTDAFSFLLGPHHYQAAIERDS